MFYLFKYNILSFNKSQEVIITNTDNAFATLIEILSTPVLILLDEQENGGKVIRLSFWVSPPPPYKPLFLQEWFLII